MSHSSKLVHVARRERERAAVGGTQTRLGGQRTRGSRESSKNREEKHPESTRHSFPPQRRVINYYLNNAASSRRPCLNFLTAITSHQSPVTKTSSLLTSTFPKDFHSNHRLTRRPPPFRPGIMDRLNLDALRNLSLGSRSGSSRGGSSRSGSRSESRSESESRSGSISSSSSSRYEGTTTSSSGSGGGSRSSRRRRRRAPSESSSDTTIIDEGPPALERLRLANLAQYGPEVMEAIRIKEEWDEEQVRLGRSVYGGYDGTSATWPTPSSVPGSVAAAAAAAAGSAVPSITGASYVDEFGSIRSSMSGSRAGSAAGNVVAGDVSRLQSTLSAGGYGGYGALGRDGGGHGNPSVPGGHSQQQQRAAAPSSSSRSLCISANGGRQRNAFWPNIKPGLVTDADVKAFAMACPQCAVTMTAAETQTGQHRATILCCGHVLCAGCVTRIAATAKKCPYCSVPVGKYVDCAGSCQDPGMIGLGFPTTADQVRRFPRTTPEGASLPGCCPTCRLLRVERDCRKLVRHILNDAGARSVWMPSSDHKPDTRDYGGYVRVPELEHFLKLLRDTVHSVEIHRQYTWLQPDHRNSHAQVWAEKRDYTRPRPGQG
ncbi:hypothetical protein CTA2_7591 [Colletotrichum tanaceti]|uniref:RING-type domain-containing protein n=1 Tax=Colletotrichum tanaceti TaxID=1306861 RepID=A0A4U6XHG3_9PEZI|nr:hypothetical protein CTA2_7591 [Colletotrichum tanaceti]TKW53497.1 hypothetical protein CTA1_12407 [Colletotrichum tanaceti]